MAARVAAWAGELGGLRIASFNINGVVKRLGNLLDWLAAAEPDVVCLQELKARGRAVPARRARGGGLRRGLARAGELERRRDPRPRRRAGADPRRAAGRSRATPRAATSRRRSRGVLIASLYAPNGNPQPGPKFDYKLAWHERLRLHAADLLASGAPVVLAGDYNVTPEPRDIYPTSSYDDNALVQPESRAAHAALLAQGWTDALRAVQPEGAVFTFWDYRRNRWQRNGGMRLDHLLLSPEIGGAAQGRGVDRAVRGEPNASDHAPVVIELGGA